MEKVDQKKCGQCKHSWNNSKTVDAYSVMCHYILDTFERRNCPIGMCDKFEPRKRGA